MLPKRKFILACAILALSPAMHTKLVDFQIINNLKQPIEYAPLGIRNNSPSTLLLGKDGRVLKENTARIVSNGGTYTTKVDTDQAPRILIRVKGTNTLKMYEFTPGSYDKIYVRIADGPNLEPQTSYGSSMKGNIKKEYINKVAVAAAAMQTPKAPAPQPDSTQSIEDYQRAQKKQLAQEAEKERFTRRIMNPGIYAQGGNVSSQPQAPAGPNA